ncbi:chemotaxis protein CheW [Natrialbaceae archaeon GCM10025810]|uniref:chemotaxis protein CheW n=1 Tax=Halovalidus salilacus TaxID=3075124 RepID=UPI00360714FC
MTAVTDRNADRVATVLTFELEGGWYCVESERVASVLGVAGDDALSDAEDPWNAGTVSIAGERVRVVDLPRVFGASAHTVERVAEPKLLVFTTTDADETHVGWLVDEVDGTATVRIGDLRAPAVETEAIAGRVEIADLECVWLDDLALNGGEETGD